VQIVTFGLNPATVQPGQTSTLTWSVRGATIVQIEGVSGLRNVRPEGMVPVRFERSTTLRLIATGPGGTASGSAAVVVAQLPANQEPDPQVLTFAAQPQVISSGQQVTLAWNTQGAAQVRISGFPNPFPPAGQVSTVPRASTRFQLVAFAANGRRAVADIQVQVAPPTAPVDPAGRQSIATRWVVMHDHEGTMSGFLPKRGGEWNRCDGVLSIASDHLRFESREPNHAFDVPLSEVQEVKTNRISIRGYRAFHVKLRSGENYNFVSRDQPDRVVGTIRQSLQ
jgi:hypothetical protein